MIVVDNVWARPPHKDYFFSSLVGWWWWKNRGGQPFARAHSSAPTIMSLLFFFVGSVIK